MRRFSIVIPAYNSSSFVRDALDSVAHQTQTDYEVIVVDDGSRDETSQFVIAWGRAHPEIPLKLLWQSNSGIGAARNTGIREANGEYVAFLDSDDLWLKPKLETVAKFLQQSSPDLICHDELLAGNGRRRRLRYGPYRTYRELLFKGNCLSTSATVVRKRVLEAVGRFSEDLRFNGAEDYELWLRLARAGARFEYLHEVLGIYRVHPKGITRNIDEHCQHQLNVVEAHFGALDSRRPADRWFLRKRRAKIFQGAGRAFLGLGEYSQARRYLRMAVSQDVFSWRAGILGLLAVARVKV